MSCLESVDKLMSLLPEVRVLSQDLKTLIESHQEEVVPSMNTKVDPTVTVLTNNKLSTIHLENCPSQLVNLVSQNPAVAMLVSMVPQEELSCTTWIRSSTIKIE
jgi:hypothetical protein